MLVSIPCGAILAKYGRTRAFSLRRPLSLRHLSLLRMPARELRHLQDCGIALEPQDESIAESLRFIRGIFRSVLLDSFRVTVALEDGFSWFHRGVVHGCGSSLRAACEDAEANVLAAREKLPCLAEREFYRLQVACKLRLGGTYFKVDDLHAFLSRYDALSRMGKSCFAKRDDAAESISLFEQPAAKVLCRDADFVDDLGSLFHQVRPVFKKHVQFIARREIRDMLDLIFV